MATERRKPRRAHGYKVVRPCIEVHTEQVMFSYLPTQLSNVYILNFLHDYSTLGKYVNVIGRVIMNDFCIFID